MDPSAIRELIALESSQMDASFEYWLAASFAVVVAAYSARYSMNKITQAVLSATYLVFTVGTLIKFSADASEINQLNELLIGTELDVDTLPIRMAAIARLAMYIVFSSLVIAFVFFAAKIDPMQRSSE